MYVVPHGSAECLRSAGTRVNVGALDMHARTTLFVVLCPLVWASACDAGAPAKADPAVEDKAKEEAETKARMEKRRQDREAKEAARDRLELEAKDGRYRKRKCFPVLWDRYGILGVLVILVPGSTWVIEPHQKDSSPLLCRPERSEGPHASRAARV